MNWLRPRHILIPEAYEQRPYYRRLATGAWQELTYSIRAQANAPTIKFLIFAQGRTGSTLLTSTLDVHPEIHCDDEILSMPRAFPYHFIEVAARQVPARAYGFHVKIYQLHAWQRMHDVGRFLDKMERQGWRIIYLWRENLLSQTVSNIFAEAAGTYHMDGRQSRPPTIELPLERLAAEITVRKSLRAAELAALQGRHFLEINYERDLQTQDSQRRTFLALQDYLGIERITLQPHLQKMVIRPLSELLSNYNDVASWLKAHPEYGHFIDTLGTK